ncbi:MAG: T9SS type A sorting domain-containing protein [Bacteroidetes bacterium]|nr:T9SS type A sorting domain-containing protein [Bacteroidota bacterium]
MKKFLFKIIVLTNSLFIAHYSFSQTPEIEWQNTIGGSSDDMVLSVIQTDDGGYFLGGYSTSGISGNKTQIGYGYEDYWVIKLNNIGNIEWQKTIGGSGHDVLNSVIETADSGYLLAGYSSSGISGDKTETGAGFEDYWVIKLNSIGEIEWQNTIGGNSYDYLFSVTQTTDEGYLLGGYSGSGISGDKTEACQGFADYWVIKLNSSGVIEWQNTIGGSGNDILLLGVIQVADGGYLLGGSSSSGISGDKTEACVGYDDYWVVKLNSAGTIEWQNTIGGNNSENLYSITQSDDGTFLLGGLSFSGISGDKTEASIGLSDFWIIKLNGAGTIEWQNVIGGIYYDYLHSVINTSDDGFILGGNSNSGISGDKTESCIGEQDYWVIKIDDTGSIEWQNTIGGNNYDLMQSVIETTDGGYLLGGFSSSGISADKTANSQGGFDYWVIKLENCTEELCNSLDDNCNGFIDDGVIETISNAAGGATTFCQGSSVLLSATYSGTSVQWKRNGINIAGATTSTYSVIKTGNYSAVTTSPCGNATSSTITVTVNKNPNANITAGGATTFCAGGSVTLSEAPVGGSTYQWYKGASAIAGATSTNYIATTAGNYKCRVTKTASGCFKNSNTIIVTVPCKEGEELIKEENNNFTIFPNPNTGTFNLVYNVPTGAISPLEGGPRGVMTMLEIFNSLNQQIYSQQINSPDGNINETISINNLSSGIYFVRIGNGNVYSQQKLIIE